MINLICWCYKFIDESNATIQSQSVERKKKNKKQKKTIPNCNP